MSSQNETSGRLTTHVLDTASGKPAANLRIDLLRLENEQFSALRSTRTNQDGRCDAPLLAGAEMRAGTYELHFHVGAYLGEQQTDGSLPFLDVVPIRFGIGDEGAHYHVPLLVAPFGYSTYRGS
ncbi:hydroxyisourate hydrolase [Phyllobacterium myrsinacearum]|uniref:5-hydroxyisourate hydrolase n=1 Tax=Phyllobacterium myrsinacearum TaxID=28101 RepID=A0A839EN73_9HYPH|nr:hydroxyisourate hydrolase [Phyllobacterium myrsinacearum]MBA8878944.1 5-hydroxyisourate hydrolase [Phyllobacterium myrsinacearum]